MSSSRAGPVKRIIPSQRDKDELECDAFWKRVFHEGPYTSLVMLDYVRQKVGYKAWEPILQGGITNSKGLVALYPVQAKAQDIEKDPNLRVTWAGLTGRCTSFALKVVTLIESKYPGKYHFIFYDVGHHRVAQCRKTSILIDSSSFTHGAFKLQENDWTTIGDSEALWKWSDGKSKFERQHGAEIKTSRQDVTREQAMTICVLEVPKLDSQVIFFRSIHPTTRRGSFHMLIKWKWSNRSLLLFPNLTDKSDTPPALLEHLDAHYVIRFGDQDASMETYAQSVKRMAMFIKDLSGPNGQAQYEALQGVHDEIFQAAVTVWGFPTWHKKAVKRGN